VARANLALTRVSAPIDGRAYGPPAAGRLVRADEDTLATLIGSGPAYVHFEAPLRLLPVLAEAGDVDGLPVAIGLSRERGFPRRGTVSLAGAQVDSDEGTLRLRATLPNDGITAGLAARVRLATGKPSGALLVPQGAVVKGKDGTALFVVNDRNEIERRGVLLGPSRDRLQVVKDGLAARDWVVLDGALREDVGATVTPRRVGLLDEAEKKESGAANARPVFRKDNGLSLALPLKHASAAEVLLVAQHLFREQHAPKGRRLRITTDDATNTVYVEGPTEQVLELVKLVAGLEELGRRNSRRPGDKVDPGQLLRVHLPAKDGGPRLGVSVEPVSAALAEQLNLPEGVGLLVTDVAAGSPAAKVGITVNDVLLKIAGAQVPADLGDFIRLIASFKSDTPLDVVVMRKGQRQKLGSVRLADGSAPAGRFEELRSRIDDLESKVAMLKDRVAWSERMVKKGYLTASHVDAQRALLRQAEIDLEKARREFKVEQGRKPQE
jgi:hypothetical protein